jgi:4-amino-4-deoxy-L-arabinose transferase-like glycosyltransferase
VQAATHPSARRRRIAGWVVLGIFLVALGCRAVLFFRAHLEGDEMIYAALVENLDAGKGYTLRGHPLLGKPWIEVETYGRPLFFHPPGGIGLFWTLHQLFGPAGFGVAQLVAFAVFFWAMLLLAAQVLGPLSALEAVLVAGLAGFTPIMTHVASRWWLDGPLLAFATLATALFLRGCRRDSLAWSALAGLALGYAGLIKPTAVLVVPGALALAWALGVLPFGALVRHALCWGGVAACVLAPWLLYQWSVIGNPFAVAPGRPAQRLIEINRYVHFLTVVRSPWIYVLLLPRAVWTLAPSLLLLVATAWRDAAVRPIGLALVGWIALVVGCHVVLGYHGYSKLLRYVILVSPATVLLFVLVTSAAWRQARAGSSPRPLRALLYVLLAVGFAGFALEIAQGVVTPVLDPSDLIRPFF